MKKYRWWSLFLLFPFLGSMPIDHIGIDQVRIPGEWEEQEAIWMGFRTQEAYPDVFDSITIPIIQLLQDRIPINLLVEGKELLPNPRSFFLQQGIRPSKVNLVYQQPSYFWYRDPGPIFAYQSNGQLSIINFAYGHTEEPALKELFGEDRRLDKIDEEVARRLKLPLLPVNVVMEGGAFETNGRGVAIQVEAVTLDRNPGLNKEQIELELQKAGIQKVIWLPQGVAEDPSALSMITGKYYGWGTGGHVDEFVRFADEHTILLAWTEEEEKDQHPIKRINNERMRSNLHILEQATDLNGNPFRIIKVPMPELIIEEEVIDEDDEAFFAEYDIEVSLGDTLIEVACASYLNYLITNNTVLVPAYSIPGDNSVAAFKDEQVYQIFSQLYPDRDIIQVNPIILNWYGGGMHCLVQTQPKALSKNRKKSVTALF